MAESDSAIRDWGRWSVLVKGEGYKVKKIEVNPGGRLSLQKHKHRSEHWTVVAGRAWVNLGGKNFYLKANESIYVERGQLHRLANAGKSPLIIIEVQVGSYVEEDDIVRLKDDYGRVKIKNTQKWTRPAKRKTASS